jgi:hypothetical protein
MKARTEKHIGHSEPAIGPPSPSIHINAVITSALKAVGLMNTT